MNTEATLILLGGGGHAAVVAEAAQSMGFSTIFCLDDDQGVSQGCKKIDMTYQGVIEDLPYVIEKLSGPFILHAAVGLNSLRKQWLSDARYQFTQDRLQTIVHASAIISPSAQIAAGAFIGPGAIINARAVIEQGAIINSGAIVEHDCVIGPFAHIAPRATLGGGAQVGSMSLIGIGAMVLPGIKVGSETILGAGALARENLPAGVTAFGIPARLTSPCQS